MHDDLVKARGARSPSATSLREATRPLCGGITVHRRWPVQLRPANPTTGAVPEEGRGASTCKSAAVSVQRLLVPLTPGQRNSMDERDRRC